MPSRIRPLRRTGAPGVPNVANMQDGEIAINAFDKKVYMRVGANLVEVANAAGGGSDMILKQQVFTESGTFTPSAGLLAAGGSVEVLLVGGGGGGRFAPSANCGGSGGQVIKRVVSVSAATTVTIGAPGVTTYDGSSTNGGATTFGPLLAKGGNAPIGSSPGHTAGEGSGGGGIGSTNIAGQPGGYGFGGGGGPTSSCGGANVSTDAVANTGGGGYGATAGNLRAASSGICIVTWWEKVL